MPYPVIKSDGTQLTIVQDLTTDTTSTSLTLVGINNPSYPEAIAENFVHLLENFSSPTAPTNPLLGQLWFQSVELGPPTTTVNKLKFWDGFEWNIVGGTYDSTTAPQYPQVGDFWYNPNTNVMSFWNGTSWVPTSNPYANQSPPVNPVEGQFWWMLPERQLWMYDTTAVTAVPPRTRDNGLGTVPTGWVLVGPVAPVTAGTSMVYDEIDSNGVLKFYSENNLLAVFSSSNITLSSPFEAGFQTLNSAQTVTNNLSTGLNLNHTIGARINGEISLADKANAWTTPMTLTANGTQWANEADVSGTVTFDGSANVSMNLAFSTTGIAAIQNLVNSSGLNSSTISISSSTALSNSELGYFVEVVGSGGITITLPPNPARGNVMWIYSYANSVTINVPVNFNINTGNNLNISSFVMNSGDNIVLNFDGGTTWIMAGGSAQLPHSSTMNGANWTTAAAGDSTTKLATTQFVTNAVNTLSTSISAELSGISTAPFGSVVFLATTTVPTGYLECNGAVISRTSYANLFAAIGTTWGAGNGSTTFSIPDLRGAFLRGWDHGRGLDANASRVFASYAADTFYNHSHYVSNVVYDSNSGNVGPRGGSYYEASVGTLTTSGAISGYGNETSPKNYALMPIIKAY